MEELFEDEELEVPKVSDDEVIVKLTRTQWNVAWQDERFMMADRSTVCFH